MVAAGALTVMPRKYEASGFVTNRSHGKFRSCSCACVPQVAGRDMGLEGSTGEGRGDAERGDAEMKRRRIAKGSIRSCHPRFSASPFLRVPVFSASPFSPHLPISPSPFPASRLTRVRGDGVRVTHHKAIKPIELPIQTLNEMPRLARAREVMVFSREHHNLSCNPIMA